ncbi:MAG: hypothetical protein ACLQPH_17395 [Acidimicrobiales bacterium]
MTVTGDVTLARALGEHEPDAVGWAVGDEELDDEEQELRRTAAAPNEITTDVDRKRRRRIGTLYHARPRTEGPAT